MMLYTPQLKTQSYRGGSAMPFFEYRITLYPIEQFKEFAFFCSEDGHCSLGEIPGDQVEKLMDILNEMGRNGWELVQIISRPSGIVALWKRSIK